MSISLSISAIAESYQGFTEVVRNLVGPLDNSIIADSSCMLRSLLSPFHDHDLPALISRKTKTGELRSRSLIMLVDRPFRVWRALLT